MEVKALWNYACEGNIRKLKRYYKSGGTKNIRFRERKKEHSLIAGAYRNGQTETVKYLLSIGETITEQEEPKLRTIIDEMNT